MKLWYLLICLIPYCLVAQAPVNNHFETIPNGQNDSIVFQIGSCAMFLGKFDKRQFKIFKVMQDQPAHFMIWMGDNLYFLKKEHWSSYAGMKNRYLQFRANAPNIATFLQSRPQYAIWDDHDYGWNDAEGDFPLKDTSLIVFKEFWANPSYGTPDAPGVFFNVRHGDAEFFFTDNRYNCKKWDKMLGDKEIAWLKEKLLASTARFKFIIMGSQILSNSSNAENWRRYETEYKDFMKFLEDRKIPGVIFFSGDRHFAEVTKLERKGHYPLYDITSSALTSPYFPYRNRNSLRVKHTKYIKHNFARVTLSGTDANRKCSVDLFSKKGKKIWTFEIKASDIQY